MTPGSLPSGDYEVDRQRHVEAMRERLADELQWNERSYDELIARRDERLREVVRHAQQHSPWHRDRLAHIDADTLTGDDLSAIPTMTKRDLMEHWDEIVCDRSLTLDAAKAQLQASAEGRPDYLGDWNHVISTGGSSAVPGIVVWDFDGWLDAFLIFVRSVFLDQQRSGRDELFLAAVVAAPNNTHMSTLMTYCFSGPDDPIIELPSTMPVEEMVAALNAAQPGVIGGFATVVCDLAAEQQAGRLAIDPFSVITSSEPCGPGQRAMLHDAFGVHLVDKWANTEAGPLLAQSEPGRDGLVLVEDAAVFEFVDGECEAAPPGDPCHRVVVTNVLNKVLPLIRYELHESTHLLDTTIDDATPGRQIAPMHYRAHSTFHYRPGVKVHPQAMDDVIYTQPLIGSYRIEQTRDGLDVTYRSAGPVDDGELAIRFTDLLRAAGLPEPQVTTRRVDALERNATTGKLRAFVPLPR